MVGNAKKLRKKAARILQFNDGFEEYFGHVKIPDESFFQTAFLNMDKQLEKYIINDCLTYVEWKGNHPKIITRSDWDDIRLSNKLFARKFDLDIDKRIINLIDKEVIGENQPKS